MKAFVLAMAAMIVIAFGASVTLNAMDQTAGEKYRMSDVPAK